jgi:hypothetical protein
MEGPMSLEPKDESVHDYPRPLDSPWKENWYFNFIDKKSGAWGVNHFSIERHKSRCRFSAFHVVDGEVLIYSNLVPAGEGFRELDDGKLKAEFIEPFQKFRLTFTGPRHRVELDYAARFGVFDYAMGKAQKPGKSGRAAMEHYEQALFAKGKVEKDGKKKEIDCFGHRDHSWGYRNESKVTAWNWVAVQFADKTVNLYRAVIGQAFIGSGFISNASGNTRIVRMNVEDTKFENKAPVSSVYAGTDQSGKVWRLKSQKFSSLYLPMKEKGDGVVIHENFSDYEDLETGEKGVGIDEYLINKV